MNRKERASKVRELNQYIADLHEESQKLDDEHLWDADTQKRQIEIDEALNELEFAKDMALNR